MILDYNDANGAVMKKRRWVIYIFIGIMFGIFDVYYQALTANRSSSLVIGLVIACGIWLVPAIPVDLYEAKISQSRLKSAAANVLTWSAAVFSYYLYIAFTLIFIGQAARPELHISNLNTDPYYWSNLASLLVGDVLGGAAEWMIIAVIGGFIVGLLVSSIYLRPLSQQK